MKRKLIDLCNKRNQHLQAAEAALTAGNVEDYDSAMEKATNLNADIQRIQNLLKEQERKLVEQQPTGAEARDMAEERGAILQKGGEVKFSAVEVSRALNQTTLAATTLVQPTGAGSEIRDPLGNVVSSIVDQVMVTDMSGMGSYMEPYVISELGANAGTVASLAGTARAAGTDPTFGIAEIKPYEINTTSYVDRNIANLSPANYYAKIQGMSMRAMRRKLASLILNGDGSSSSPVFFGMKTAKNKAGANIFATADVSAVDVNLLDTLYFAYGSSDAMGPNARLLLTKADLKAIGALRGTNEKRRLFEVIPDTGNPNTGTIRDGGLVIPYTICSDLTTLSGTAAGTDDILTMGYGDPMNFEVGLFGDFTVRVDESVKAVERMHTILGDAMVGGNLIVDKGMVWAKLPKATGAG